MIGLGPVAFPETNLEVWVKLDEEPCNTNTTILETMQELKSEMPWLRSDNERLMQEQEKIMKSLSNKKNQRQPIPNPKDWHMTREQEYQAEYL